jgi:hypothetical protein
MREKRSVENNPDAATDTHHHHGVRMSNDGAPDSRLPQADVKTTNSSAMEADLFGTRSILRSA